MELVDTLALGASAFGREGSSPFSRTIINSDLNGRFLLWFRRTNDLILRANELQLILGVKGRRAQRSSGKVYFCQSKQAEKRRFFKKI